MERGSITKWLLIGLAAFLFFSVGLPWLRGTGGSSQQPFQGIPEKSAPAAPDPKTCTVDGGRFQAELSERDAALTHVRLTDGRYTLLERDEAHGGEAGKPIDLVTTTLPDRMPLRVDLRAPGGDEGQQVAADDFDWKLTAQDSKSCTFTYKDDTTALTKTITATNGPFELGPFQLDVTLKVENLASAPKKHRFAIEQTSWRTKKEMSGNLGRQSEFLTETTAITSAKTARQSPSDFEAKALEKDAGKPSGEKEFTPERWREFPGDARAVAVSSTYFSKILVPIEGSTPTAETQIQETWRDKLFSVADKEKDPEYGYIFRARLAYPEVELPPNGSATYKVLSFNGPKERQVLTNLGHGATEVLDLGTFAPIAQKLVWYVLKLHDLVKSWGWAIVLLTITIRLLLFPLSLSQIKSTMAMRKLKPEMDALNAKYKDDATQRGVAIQELWRKNGVTNPVLGCLPMLLQMPIWWALYRTLQTAVELYHVPFGPVIPDLSAPGKYFVIPVVLGASSFFQQKIMPPQGDPQQQKMMMYMMPAVFTFMMLFLPAGLGVYMLTNTWLGIGQQLLVERYYKAKGGGSGTIEVREKTLGDGGKPTPALGKGKVRARG